MVTQELKLTKRVTADEEVFKLQRIVVEVFRAREVELGRFYVLSTAIEARGHMGSCPRYALLTSQGDATGFPERIGTTILAGEVRRETDKDRVAERKRVRGNRRVRIERGAGDVPEKPVDKYDEQVAVRHADACGGHIIENQHEKKRKRDIQVSGAAKASSRPYSTKHQLRKARASDLWSRILRWAAQTRRPTEINERGSKATNEEQTDKWRKTVRFEQEALNTSASSDPYVALEHPVRDETPSRTGSVLVQRSFEHISALDVFYQKDERENRCIGEVLGRYRGEDAGDLKRSELNVLVETWTCLNAPGRIF